MFGKFRKEEPDVFAAAITKLVDELEQYDPTDPEFANAIEKLEQIVKVQGQKAQRSINPDTLLIVGGNLLGILIIVAYEQKHVLTSKASGFILKPKTSSI